MTLLNRWLVALAIAAIAVAVAYLWLDRPIAYFVHDHFTRYKIFDAMQRVAEWVTFLAVVAVSVIGLRALSAIPLWRVEKVILLSGVSLVVTAAVKNQLKFLFGRTWPETWINNNPSLIHDRAFGFNWFHGGPGYASFPSGHTAAICAAMSVFWICYPRYRPIYALLIAIVVVGLIGANYHFLSDVIAGGFIGWSSGIIAVTLWKASVAPPLPNKPLSQLKKPIE